MDDKYDLGLSIEVAEHIDEKYADPFVDGLCAAADLIIFSAAMPYQEGDHHVNCQYPSYWIRKFESRGYYADDRIRLSLWNDDSVVLHCRMNCMIFVNSKSRYADKYQKCEGITDYVHPEFMKMQMNKIYNGTF